MDFPGVTHVRCTHPHTGRAVWMTVFHGISQ
jgi:hypothetical protein